MSCRNMKVVMMTMMMTLVKILLKTLKLPVWLTMQWLAGLTGQMARLALTSSIGYDCHDWL